MADEQQKPTQEKNPGVTPKGANQDPNEGERDRTGQGVTESTATNDTALADEAGITEGEVHALRDDAGLNQSAGSMAHVGSWAASPAGKSFKEGEKDRQKAAEEEAERYDEQFDKDGLNEAEKRYFEATGAEVGKTDK